MTILFLMFSLAKDSEKVLDLESHVFGQVRAMDAVEDLVFAVLCADRLGAQVPGNFRVSGADKFSEFFVFSENLRI